MIVNNPKLDPKNIISTTIVKGFIKEIFKKKEL